MELLGREWCCDSLLCFTHHFWLTVPHFLCVKSFSFKLSFHGHFYYVDSELSICFSVHSHLQEQPEDAQINHAPIKRYDLSMRSQLDKANLQPLVACSPTKMHTASTNISGLY